jgi:hypothetical protein
VKANVISEVRNARLSRRYAPLDRRKYRDALEGAVGQADETVAGGLLGRVQVVNDLSRRIAGLNGHTYVAAKVAIVLRKVRDDLVRRVTHTDGGCDLAPNVV